MSVKLIALDFDGTLRNEKCQIDPELRDILLKVINQGIKVGIASGREIGDIESFFIQEKVRPDNFFPHFLILRERLVYYRDNETTYLPDKKWNEKRLREIREFLPYLADNLECFLKVVTKLDLTSWKLIENYGLLFSFTQMKEAEKAMFLIRKKTSHMKPMSVYSNVRLVLITTPTAGKGRALNYLIKQSTIKNREILAIGDSFNDQDMLDGTYNFLAGVPANANDRLKKIVASEGGIISNKPYGKGTAEIISHFI